MLALVAATCAAAGRRPQIALTPEEWEIAVGDAGLDPRSVINPLAFTPEIEQATRKATGVATTLEKLERIQEYLFDPDSAFDYDFVGTLTASEAFDRRKGNCVAFTNLFIAMARSIGIPVQAALVSPRGKPETEGDIALVRNHIVALYRHAEGSTVYDFFTSRTGAPITIRPIDDLWSTSIYINNLGVSALREGDLELALRRFESAARLAPAYAAVYGNVGVARRRMGDAMGALDAYLTGLLIEPHNSSIRGNLQQALEELARAAHSEAQAAGSGFPGPELKRLMADAADELVRGEVRLALKLYARAHQVAPEDAAPVLGMARCELLRGRPDAARRRLETALDLDPADLEAKRLLEPVQRVFLAKTRGKRKSDRSRVVKPEPSRDRDERGPDS